MEPPLQPHACAGFLSVTQTWLLSQGTHFFVLEEISLQTTVLSPSWAAEYQQREKGQMSGRQKQDSWPWIPKLKANRGSVSAWNGPGAEKLGGHQEHHLEHQEHSTLCQPKHKKCLNKVIYSSGLVIKFFPSGSVVAEQWRKLYLRLFLHAQE